MQELFIKYLWFFVIYSFLGWGVEVIFHTVTKGDFVNRGFLNGPVCPIYGFGMIILLYLLGPLADKVLFLFIASVLVTSLLEYIVGFLLEKVFNNKWWDYSDNPFNIKGYICLSFSIMWGLGAVFMINIVHPYIDKFIFIFDNKVGNYLLVLIILYFISDFIVTVFGVLKINRRFRLLKQISKRLHLYSDGIGKGLHKGVTTTMKNADKVHSKIQGSKIELKTMVERDIDIHELREKYNKLLKEKHFVQRRLEKAFPSIKEKLSKFEENNNLK